VKFSVVIPLYNKAPYIESAIQSVLKQTFSDLEVIVIDDGSVDGGGELAAAIVDPRVRVLRQKNAGVSEARNRGIEIANGEWIAFLDADDWHHPHYLATLVSAQNLHPHADVAATTYLTIPHVDGATWPPAWDALPAPLRVELIDDLPARWIQAPTLYTSSVTVRTERLRAMQPCFAPGESYGEDVDLWFRLGERSSIVLVQEPLVAYRVSLQDSLSANNSPLIIPPFLSRMRQRALSGDMSPIQRRSLLKLVGHHEITMAREALALGKRFKAVTLLLNGSYAARTMRWWSTAAMTLFFPGNLVRQWQSWRVRRASPTLRTG
jgi:glycosyltransferase involved in cell wall biosynthesis